MNVYTATAYVWNEEHESERPAKISLCVCGPDMSESEAHHYAVGALLNSMHDFEVANVSRNLAIEAESKRLLAEMVTAMCDSDPPW